MYPDLEFVRRHVSHFDEIPLPVLKHLHDKSDEESSTIEVNSDAPHPFGLDEWEWFIS